VCSSDLYKIEGRKLLINEDTVFLIYLAQITDVISPTIIEVDRSWAEEAQFVRHVWGNPGTPAPNEAEDGEWAQGKEWEYPFKRAQSNWRLKEKRDLAAAKAFFQKAFRSSCRPDKVNIDKSGSNVKLQVKLYHEVRAKVYHSRFKNIPTIQH
jgi:hypothetical protein